MSNYYNFGKTEENTYSEKEYITEQYINRGILDKNGKKINKSNFDFNIYPDEQYFPVCRICSDVHDLCKKNNDPNATLISPHLSCGCFWWKYFEDKILKFYPNVKIVKNNKDNNKDDNKNDNNNVKKNEKGKSEK